MRSVYPCGRNAGLYLYSRNGSLAGTEGDPLRTSGRGEGGGATALETCLDGLLLLTGELPIVILTDTRRSEYACSDHSKVQDNGGSGEREADDNMP